MDLITRKELYNYLKNENDTIDAEINIDELNCLNLLNEKVNFLEFEDFEFTDANFYKSSFHNCRFNKCIFNNAVITNNLFSECIFDNCLFENISFSDTLFEKCRIKNLKTKNIEFVNSRFNSAEFCDTILEINDLKYLTIFQSYFDINSEIVFNCRLDNNLKITDSIFKKHQSWTI